MKNGWIEEQGALQKNFKLSDFKEALLFVNKVGEAAERLQHHPDICIKNYSKVFISTTTHEKGGVVTERDRELANAIEGLFQHFL